MRSPYASSHRVPLHRRRALIWTMNNIRERERERGRSLPMATSLATPKGAKLAEQPCTFYGWGMTYLPRSRPQKCSSKQTAGILDKVLCIWGQYMRYLWGSSGKIKMLPTRALPFGLSRWNSREKAFLNAIGSESNTEECKGLAWMAGEKTRAIETSLS